MNERTRRLHDAGQSLWVDNITRGMLADGTLQRYIDDYSVTGLTSNPTIFDLAVSNSADYDESIRGHAARGLAGEDLCFQIILEDLATAADRFAPIHERTAGVDGWVSLEVSPALAYDARATVAQAKDLRARARRDNVFIKIPGTPEGAEAIEQAIFEGVPVNVTLLFSEEQYLTAADAYLAGIERRVKAGLSPNVASVASLFVSRWDKALTDRVEDRLRGKLGIATGLRTYRAYRNLLNSDRWLRLANRGARPQRLLWASTGAKDPRTSDLVYVDGLVAPFTVNTMPDKTLLAFADHGEVGAPLPVDGGDADELLAEFTKLGVDYDAMAAKLQQDGAADFVKSWDSLLAAIAGKSALLAAR
jgi:transaldolase